MSISTALNAALSGLTAASRRAEVVSSNVANAATPGYGRRQVELASGLVGGLVPGVSIIGVTRKEDLLLLSQRRGAEAGLANAQVRADFLNGTEDSIGLPDEPGSLSDRLSSFETSLIEAASRPDSEARLLAVAETASRVAEKLNALHDKVQDERLNADRAIAESVDDLNSALRQVVNLNAKIIQFSSSTRDTSSLIDARQQVIDSIAGLIPVQQVPRDNGAIALFSPGGAMLVDSKAADFGFTGVPMLTVYMTQAGGGLSGLTINGQDISTGAENGPISGGRLDALFRIRDEIAPGLQTQLDAVARNLIERFEDVTVDPTLTAGDPGLFTDNGLALDLTEELGLAGRISLNALADPDQGGAVWRIRDGLGAAAIGDPGNASLLNALSAALADDVTPGSGVFSVARDAIGLAGDFLSYVSIGAFAAESQVSYSRAETDALITAELQDAVDTDQEMQELLLVEQAYTANARVMASIDEMMQQILGL
ncbi:flagellar hook-associated protein FlgK [Pseudoruegeria sp. HB172150]|uniref:flagellar hook-associated protein FlgK n=1 Tax=Pseudoruegeria sp. HB172150 TaxID=2721164 RepID=UPI001551AF44|nr:flagellar hook-associated protein FlgK [Pseudoruegeria sp. HB172150]